MSTDYSTLEAARLLGMAVRSVQMMVDRGELEAWKTPGGHRRISQSSVESWRAARLRRGPDSIQTPLDPLPSQPLVASAPPGATVLLIEDSVHCQNLITLLVRQQFPGVVLHVANDGIAGLAMAGRLQPQVMIVDILLPGIDSAALIISLRSHAQFSGVHLLMVTPLDETGQAPLAFALAGLPVVHRSRLVAELPGHLDTALRAVSHQVAA